MKPEWNKKYTTMAIYIFVIIVASSLFILFLLGARDFFVNKEYSGVFKLIKPFIYGLIFAYLLNPVLNFYEKKIFSKLVKRIKNFKARRILSLLSAYLTMLIVISLLILMVVPQVGDSIAQLAAKVSDLFSQPDRLQSPSGESYDGISGIITGEEEYEPISSEALYNTKIAMYVSDIAASLQKIINDMGLEFDLEQTATDAIMSFTANITNFLASYIQPIFNTTAAIIYSTANEILQFFIGIIISIYLLSNKEYFINSIKKVLLALLSLKLARRIMHISRRAHKIVGGYITGVMLDSIMVSIICLIFMQTFNFKYAPLISVIIGVTNMIPFFGPFIGAVPSIFFLAMNDIWQALAFAVFILVMQQIDGNIIAPKIIGSSIGLSPIWVIFSIVVMGGLFGIPGMFFGAPVFAVIYDLIKDFINERLRKKQLVLAAADYFTDDNEVYIDKNDKDTSGGGISNIGNFVGKILNRIHKEPSDNVKDDNNSKDDLHNNGK